MVIDEVHDLQQVYRKILHCMSRPGTISSLKEGVEHGDLDVPCYDATFLSALTLLDAEVSFAVVSENSPFFSETLAAYTLAKVAPTHEADYIIVLQDASEHAVLEALHQCKVGQLIDPQRSATWIMERSLIENQAELRLTGPGIQEEAVLKMGFPSKMWQVRNERVKEYPLGIDMICTDVQAQLVCIPRTTKVDVLEGM
ncbi:phosphonate C-P lyase system protein PhnH [Shouchella shacheensis]|uniref:phosphonate C-P lyase system protein PhnH n=1 Tax=Shouchella shacheensis TaxID=1649580 RepID=UPI00074025FA|nr:phosphonate C-P lyase system protein PhnH [Shouchella shacheensis]